MRKILIFLLMVSPIALLLGNTLYCMHTVKSDDNIVAEGKCLETFNEEHWHKNRPPTISTYTVVRVGHHVYLVDGPCETARKVPWQIEHDTQWFIGQLGMIIGGIILFFLAVGIVSVWVAFFLTIYNGYEKGKFWKTFKKRFTL